jgi:hypothetical protein
MHFFTTNHPILGADYVAIPKDRAAEFQSLLAESPVGRFQPVG